MLRSVIFAVFIVGCLGIEPKTQVSLDSRIVGGIETDISQHPYLLSLQTTEHICGASIISSIWAVTAAHCMGLDANEYSLLAGSTDVNLGTRYTIRRIIQHFSFNSETNDYDIALLEIDDSFSFDENVQPIELATEEPETGAIMTVTGWGSLMEDGPPSDNLMEVSIPIVSRDTCQGAYPDSMITNRMICAGYSAGGSDSCQGDSGGPLTMNGILYGIVSWGNGCGEPGYPGVYTNVARLRSWITCNSGV